MRYNFIAVNKKIGWVSLKRLGSRKLLVEKEILRKKAETNFSYPLLFYNVMFKGAFCSCFKKNENVPDFQIYLSKVLLRFFPE